MTCWTGFFISTCNAESILMMDEKFKIILSPSVEGSLGNGQKNLISLLHFYFLFPCWVNHKHQIVINSSLFSSSKIWVHFGYLFLLFFPKDLIVKECCSCMWVRYSYAVFLNFYWEFKCINMNTLPRWTNKII